MGTPFLSEIRVVSFNFAPKGWAFCNGQLLLINQNQALFSLLGTTYGGDGRVNFALPNLQGRAPVHMGGGIVLGETGGETAHTLNISELPAHNHVPVGSPTNPATFSSAAGHLWGFNSASPQFAPNPDNTAMNPACILATGGSQPHDNMSPYLVLNFIIALQGIFPSQV
ncbi:MAG TPA: tail fiber protein [Candidatus Angelobacter sp.]|nr:tail fiber protein [Candidatus Angelobacter sp.]